MNEELLRIRELSENDEKVNGYRRIPDRDMLTFLHNLNINMTELYHENVNRNYDEKFFVARIMDNVYTILLMFDKMNVFPGFFFRKVFEMNNKYIEMNSDYDEKTNTFRVKSNILDNHRLFKETYLPAWIANEIRRGLENGYYRPEAYSSTNISDAFVEILTLFQKYNIPYKITTKERCQKVFNDLSINYVNISDELLNSNYDFVDVECLCRMLYEYISFFVSIGYNPKDYLDALIEQRGMKNQK